MAGGLAVLLMCGMLLVAIAIEERAGEGGSRAHGDLRCVAPGAARAFTEQRGYGVLILNVGAGTGAIISTTAMRLSSASTGKASRASLRRCWCVLSIAASAQCGSPGRTLHWHSPTPNPLHGAQIAALSNAAGIGGGAFYVPLNHLIVGFGQ